MPLDVVITLSDEDLEKFQESIDKGKLLVEDAEASRKIEDAAYEMIEKAHVSGLPNFVSERLLKLRILLNMIRDEEWQLTDDEKKPFEVFFSILLTRKMSFLTIYRLSVSLMMLCMPRSYLKN